MEKRVAIVGAGISGLLACKYTLSKGFHPIVFEAKSSVGGVWAKTLESTKLQNSKNGYQFSDFPWPDSVKENYPTQRQIHDYLQLYADRFELLKHVKFNSKVVGIAYQGPSDQVMRSWTLWGGNGEPFSSNGKWKVEVQDTNSLSIEEYKVEFVILCLGRFSDVPNFPEFPDGQGIEAFDGEVMHSMDFSNMDYGGATNLKGKRVTVVGFEKSAQESAIECSAVNGVEQPCTVLYRTAHWIVTDLTIWGVHLAFLCFNRFAELMVHKPGEGFLLALLATLLAPLRWAISTAIETNLKNRLGLAKHGAVPKESFLDGLNSCVITLTPDFYEKVEEGSIKLKKFQGFNFCKEGINIDGEDTPLETDVVIFATGFKGDEKLRDIFVSKTFQEYIFCYSDKTVSLYRECIHPRIPQLAVIGFSEGGSHLFKAEMQCRWVGELLDGTFKLPSIIEMEEDVSKWDKYKRSYSRKYHRKSCLAGINIWYYDQLCKDMGWNPMRKKGFFADLFIPYGPLDYVSP